MIVLAEDDGLPQLPWNGCGKCEAFFSCYEGNESCVRNSTNTFQQELETLINKHSKENDSNTPDFILAEYINGCLKQFNKAVNARAKWYGHSDSPIPVQSISINFEPEVKRNDQD